MADGTCEYAACENSVNLVRKDTVEDVVRGYCEAHDPLEADYDLSAVFEEVDQV